ncbi:hypothetical protein, conserved [Trypanosoma brucei gambiense DAL972]|uniref:Uncharacterized protein n=1 Tax=Trypanosoma brucei gambiense (strain MHOM/CI/86/DAL972) TaxID=679716 RepID=D0A9D9_TRYB9|nr:hypothetical protein, conserved [Trypanosoma brucei gambiense DAL972]CBH18290.1 hypothetical protein, conserved [Trypanosoma brucei gambiense DAL972]|eukprot:XP_011780554.1 hypothetical protein, conserved [Trypanosoma brucei gambiense DAL972]
MTVPVRQARIVVVEPPTNSGGAVGEVPQGQKVKNEQRPPDMFVACFEAALNEELREKTISNDLRSCFEQISSPYGFIRNEGLRGALQWLCDVSVEAAREGAASTECGDGSSGAHVPYDAIRSSVMKRDSGEPHGPQTIGKTKLCHSDSWDRVQRALRGAHYTSSVFLRVLVPRVDGGRPYYGPSGPVNVELSEEEALTWNTLSHARQSTSLSASSPHAVASPNACKRKPLDVALTEVTYQEQELALRLLQGLSLTIYDQRRMIAEGRLIPFAIEVWQCCLQHAGALFTRQRRRAAVKKAQTVDGFTGAVTLSESVPMAQSTTDEGGPVRLDRGLENVVIACIDAVEAVCHYNPLALTRIVQQGGVRALLDLGLCPYAPRDIRCSVFDTISVLMQEVAPFRCAVAAGAAGAAARGGARGDEDSLIHTMIQNAMSGNNISCQEVPLPYLMDRASASKFDSAVREWFSQKGLSHVVSAVMELRNVRGTPIVVKSKKKVEVARTVQRMEQIHEKRLHALLEAVDGKRAAL